MAESALRDDGAGNVGGPPRCRPPGSHRGPRELMQAVLLGLGRPGPPSPCRRTGVRWPAPRDHQRLGRDSLGTIGATRYHHGRRLGHCRAAAVAVVRALGPAVVAGRPAEHYLPGSVVRLLGRWWRLTPVNFTLALAALVAAGASVGWPIAGVVVAAVVAVGPIGLSLRGRTSSLAWTRRLRVLACGVVRNRGGRGGRSAWCSVWLRHWRCWPP